MLSGTAGWLNNTRTVAMCQRVGERFRVARSQLRTMDGREEGAWGGIPSASDGDDFIRSSDKGSCPQASNKHRDGKTTRQCGC